MSAHYNLYRSLGGCEYRQRLWLHGGICGRKTGATHRIASRRQTQTSSRLGAYYMVGYVRSVSLHITTTHIVATVAPHVQTPRLHIIYMAATRVYSKSGLASAQTCTFRCPHWLPMCVLVRARRARRAHVQCVCLRSIKAHYDRNVHTFP